MVKDIALQLGLREGERPHFVVQSGGIKVLANEPRGGLERVGGRVIIQETTGIANNAGIKEPRTFGVQIQARCLLNQVKNHFRHRTGVFIDPLQIPIGIIIGMMIDFDQLRPLVKALIRHPGTIGGIDDNHQRALIQVIGNGLHLAEPIQIADRAADLIHLLARIRRAQSRREPALGT